VRPALPLRIKVFLIVLLNLGLVALVLTVFVRLQLRREFASFLMDQARGRIESVTRLLSQSLDATDPADRDVLLDRYSATYGVRFLLVRNDGRRIAGPALAVPEHVRERLRGPGPRRPPDEAMGPGPGPDPGRRWPGPPPLPGAPPFLVIADGDLPYWVGIRMPVSDPSGEPAIPGTLLLASSSFWTNPFFFQSRPWLVMAAIVIAVSVLCWAPFIGGVTRSIRRLTRATGEIADGRFGVHVEEGRRDELGRLGASIQVMSSRLESMVRGQKRFLGDAAHELRSPLARIQIVLALLERRGNEADRENLADLREDVELMTRLTDELLAFARSELRPDAVPLVPTPLAEIAERVVKLEARDGADVRVEVANGLSAQADPESLFRALANVVRNAVRHAGGAGPILLGASANGRDVVVTVADSGPGIPAASLDRVFEPFYRVEESRSRQSGGGVGLGLAIARSCVVACGGSIECRNRTPEPGLLVTIRLRAA
jgi:two-component system sensor histidine kinase CpxA